jgi:hypothetical protein
VARPRAHLQREALARLDHRRHTHREGRVRARHGAAVFDKIREVALDSNLTPARMVRRVLVFSDMEFDVV